MAHHDHAAADAAAALGRHRSAGSPKGETPICRENVKGSELPVGEFKGPPRPNDGGYNAPFMTRDDRHGDDDYY